jgi:GT2 family glycosyltransferase
MRPLTNPTRITVALPTCNGTRHLREALAGLEDQGGVAFDLVVSDDRSDDETLTIVRELLGDRARVSVNSERLGLAGNWNKCVELSRTEWVAIFHQDDVMRPGHLASHLRSIEAHPCDRLGLVAGAVEMIDDSGRPVSPRVVDAGGLVFRDGSSRDVSGAEQVLSPGAWISSLTVGNPLRCSAVTIRKAAHEAVGGFDPSYRYAVDWEFWLRVARDWGLIWRPLPATVAMRWHLASETHRFKTSTADLDEQSRLLDRINQDELPRSPTRRAADRRLARAFLNRAHFALKAGDTALARRCLSRSIVLDRGVFRTMVFDPRLAVQMAALTIAPEFAARWLGRRED